MFSYETLAATTELSDPTTQLPRILLLDNCDADYKVPPFNDAVLIFNIKGEVINQIAGLNVCQNIGGNRAISVLDDGHFFVVCENVAGNGITAIDSGGNIIKQSAEANGFDIVVDPNANFLWLAR